MASTSILLDSIGQQRDARGIRSSVANVGVDPVAVRAAVLAKDGHPMTPLPVGLHDEIDVAQVRADSILMRCPIWTAGGRSGWTIEIACNATHFPRAYVERLVHADGDVVEAASAPCPDQAGRGWADDADFSPEIWPGADDDPRIPRGAFVGSDVSVLCNQIVAGASRVLADTSDVRALQPGPGAVVLLAMAYYEVFSDGIDAPYMVLSQPDFETAVITALERVGASGYAEVFRDMLDLLPDEARGSRDARNEYLSSRTEVQWERCDALNDKLFAVGDTGDDLWLPHLVRYVEANPDEFFLPDT